jgi:VPDSG-CTERM motif
LTSKLFSSSSSQAERSILVPGKPNMHFIRFVPSGIAIAAVLVTQSAIAQAPAPTPHQLVITENPDNFLTVTYDGSAGAVTVVQERTPNAWDLFFPSSVIFPATVEPESSALMNEVRRAQGRAPVLQVVSDIPTSGLPAADGSTVTFGTDALVPISVTFYDRGTVANTPATVPDTGSTLGLLSFALAGLFGASRFRCLQLASRP